MAISFDSIGQECVTATSTSTISANTPCKFLASKHVGACADGNAIHGICIRQEGSLVTLQIKGFVTLPYSGSAPTVGFCSLAAAASGKVKKLENAKEYLVVDVNTTNSTVTFLL